MSKYYTKYFPYVVFFSTVLLGFMTIFFVYLIENAFENESVVPTEVSAEVDTQIATVEVLEQEEKQLPPVCLSFLSASGSVSDESGIYPPDATFDFSVAA